MKSLKLITKDFFPFLFMQFRKLKILFNPPLLFHKLRIKCSRLYADRVTIEELWNRCMDYELNLDNPRTFNEKMQWLKLYFRDPLYTILADKYESKKWISSNIGQQYVVPILGVFRTFDEINFDELPNQFVLKCNHDCGSVIVCKDKSKFDIFKAKQKLEKHLSMDFFLPYREWCYKDIPRRIICEQYMQNEGNAELTDYKFFCFNGIPKFLYVSYGLSHWEKAFINYMNLDWTPAPFHRPDFPAFKEIPPKPSKFDEMLEISKEISALFPFVRVDFYQINDQIYISELTFYPGAGLDKFIPEIWDTKIGDMLILPSKKN